MPSVRVTQFPDQVLEVGEAEYLDLKRQGLIYEDPAEESKPRQAAAQPAKKEEN